MNFSYRLLVLSLVISANMFLYCQKEEQRVMGPASTDLVPPATVLLPQSAPNVPAAALQKPEISVAPEPKKEKEAQIAPIAPQIMAPNVTPPTTLAPVEKVAHQEAAAIATLPTPEILGPQGSPRGSPQIESALTPGLSAQPIIKTVEKGAVQGIQKDIVTSSPEKKGEAGKTGPVAKPISPVRLSGKPSIKQKKEAVKPLTEGGMTEKKAPKKKPIEQPEGPVGSYVSRAKMNEEADSEFIQWLVHDPHSFLSSYTRALLTDEAIDFIASKSSQDIHGQVDTSALQVRIQAIFESFMKKYGKDKKINSYELKLLIGKVVAPEHIFDLGGNEKVELNKIYNTFMNSLKGYVTPVNTTLQDWALRYLTSELILIALQFIKAVRVDERTFNELTPNEKEAQLAPIIDILTQRFLNNMVMVQRKFNVTAAGRVDEALKYKIRQFLFDKFVSLLS